VLITFLLVIHTIIALALVGVILIQRSEGGGLGIGGGGGGPAGLMTARGAANLLTRATTILATLFIITSILLAVLAGVSRKSQAIDTTLAKPAQETQAPAAPGLPLPATAPDDVPLAK
jgi:preprotein translocase subunit SecG